MLLVIDGTGHWPSISNFFFSKKAFKWKDFSVPNIMCQSWEINAIKRQVNGRAEVNLGWPSERADGLKS